MAEDKILILRCKAKSTDALRRVYQKYRDDLLIIAIALLNDVSSAEDVLHDVFVAFAQNIAQFRLTGSLRGYLATCVANRARNMLKSPRRNSINIDDIEPVAAINDPSDSIVCSEQLDILRRALAQLPDEQRETVVLHLHGCMRFKQIAAEHDVSVNTAKSRYRYGIDKLRVILNGQVKS